MTRARRSITPGHPILVVSAFEPELALLRRRLGETALGGDDVQLIPVGIGAVEAAVGATRALLALTPRMAIFLGTAGAYHADLAIERVAIAHRLTLASTAVVRGDGYLPAPLPVHAATNDGLRAGLLRAARAVSAGGRLQARDDDTGAGASQVDVACPSAITGSRALGRRLAAATGAAAENLEVFAVARAAAAAANLPFGAVLGISNRVGPGAHIEWRRHQKAATAAATAVVFDFILREIGAKEPSRSRRRRSRTPAPS